MEQGLPEAKVQLWYEDGSDAEILHGTWATLPWGLQDTCYCVALESGQSLHIWLEGLTGRERSAKRLILADAVGATKD
ncbi:MAG: hypothetical protein ABI610_02790 [Acidobacteriota bacterium]